MTRIRTTPTINPSDGGAFNPPNRPTKELIPTAFKARLAELDDITDRYNAADAEHSSIVQNWGTLELEAHRADANTARESARAGADVPTATPNGEKLRNRRDKVKRTRDALAAARSDVINELAEIRTEEQKHLPKYQATEDKARAELLKLLEPLEAAVSNLAAAIALREWVELHYPFDTSTAFDVRDLWEPANRLNATNSNHAVRVTNIITALENL
ncbi:hypothetical protein [Agromyces bauzanensis]